MTYRPSCSRSSAAGTAQALARSRRQSGSRESKAKSAVSRELSAAVWFASLCLLLGAAAAARSGVAFFSAQAFVPGNTFTTIPCFYAGDTGLLNPSAQAADTGGDGNGFELNPTNAFADGGGSASNVDGGGDRHRYYDYSIAVPDACAVKGIEVRLDWWLSTTLDTNSMSVELSWDGGTSWTAAKTDAVETSSEHTALLGGAADLWGRAWTAGELSNATFRVRLTTNCSGLFCPFRDFFLDWVPVRVYYGL
jgi:hypothetical protein